MDIGLIIGYTKSAFRTAEVLLGTSMGSKSEALSFEGTAADAIIAEMARFALSMLP
jgi:hypothetical protein